MNKEQLYEKFINRLERQKEEIIDFMVIIQCEKSMADDDIRNLMDDALRVERDLNRKIEMARYRMESFRNEEL